MYNENEKLKINSIMAMYEYLIEMNWRRTNSSTTELYSKSLSCVMREPAFYISEYKGADQLCGNRTADQRLCFRYIDSATPLLSKS